MIPDGFGDPISGFENPYRQAGPNTSDLTVGHTPWSSTSCRPAFVFPSHRVSTTATHFWDGGKETAVFISFFCLRSPGTSSTGSATATATATASTWGSWWSWAGRAGGRAAHRRTSALFVDGGHCIGMRDVANPSASSPFLSIFIEQIQPSP